MLFMNLSDSATAFLGIFFVTAMTTAGAAMVFLFHKDLSEKVKPIFLGFAAGIMTAASVWSLLLPAMDEADAMGLPRWIPAAVGFLGGGIFLLLVDNLLPHLHLGEDKPEGLHSSLKRTTMLVFAVTLHNIPEGLAVGLAFGFALFHGDPVMVSAAFGLALGIGIQNFPEGAAISLPLRQEGMKPGKAFVYGTLSGIVEPIFAVLGIFLAFQLAGIMPWFLAFAAGAMVYVVVEELIPEARIGVHSNVGTIAMMVGFALMMVLDVALS